MTSERDAGFADGWRAHVGMQLVGNPVTYAALYPSLVAVGREHGYAVALHGSLRKDMDVIAIPWTEEASSAEDLVDAVVESTKGSVLGDVTAMPHGRLVWTINLASGAYIDFGVIARLRAETPTRRERPEKDIRVLMDAAYQVGVHPPGKVLGAIDRVDMWLRTETPSPEPLYPCAHPGCEVMRTKAEGGTVFAVCDEHFREHYHMDDPPEPDEEARYIVVDADGEVCSDYLRTLNGARAHVDGLVDGDESQRERWRIEPVGDDQPSTEQGEVERLRAALERFLDPETWACSGNDKVLCDHCDYQHEGFDGKHDPECPVDQARRALEGEGA